MFDSVSPAAVVDYLYGVSEYVLLVLYVAMALSVSVHATLWKRNSQAVIGWIGVAWLSPYVGAIAYYLLGINRIRRRAVLLSVRRVWRQVGKIQLSEREAAQREALDRDSGKGMIRLSQHLSSDNLLPGNAIVPLSNGDQAFPEMLQAIRSAGKSVSLCSFIFDYDPTGKKFVEALAAAVQRGVEVRVLIDGVGASYTFSSTIRRLRRAAVPVAAFLPTRVPRLPNTANLRNHRKIMVVDGELGFTGGTNIRHDHCLQEQPRKPTRCLHFRLQGPIIRHLQQTFAVDWAFATGESLQGEQWFPSVERHGDIWAQGISAGPDEDFEKLSDLLVGAISMARESVQLATPYFLPPPALMQVLGVAAMRGLEVDIVLPGKCNIPPVYWATMAEIRPLLERGCRVHLSPPPFDHSKLLIVDRAWSLIGSTNWDQRSLRLNFEFNVECYSEDFASQLQAIMADKLAHSQRLTIPDLDRRSLARKLRDGTARLFGPYL